VLTSRDNDGSNIAQQRPQLLGYFVRDAIITETSANGMPNVRFAATEAKQDIQDNSVMLSTVRGDYLWSNDQQPANAGPIHANHWVLNADTARIRGKSITTPDRIELRGNVEAHSVNAIHPAAISAPSLDIDVDRHLARSDDAVQLGLDGHTVNGRGLHVDMDKNHLQIESNVTMRLAENKPLTTKRARNNEPPIVIPDLWESASIDVIDNLVVLKNVRSKVEPFIAADQLRANGPNLANNQVELSGAVRLELPKRGLITADTAIATVHDNRVVQIRLIGKPVEFQHQSKGNNEVVRGRGAIVDYDVATQTLRFTGESWFSKANFEYTSKTLFEYNMASETAHAGQSSIRVAPRKDAAGSAPAPTATTDTSATKP
jgi:LPS export ABC transporter protein LptC